MQCHNKEEVVVGCFSFKKKKKRNKQTNKQIQKGISQLGMSFLMVKNVLLIFAREIE